MILKKLSKKGQEEMIGFVLIVVLVMIILAVFLVLYLNDKSEPSGSSEIESFLVSAGEYTSGCAEDYSTDFYSLKGLIAACRDGESCYSNGNLDSCKVLKTELEGMLENSWKIGFNEVKGYELEILTETEPAEEFPSLISKGEKTPTYNQEKISFRVRGKIDLILKIYR